jgi:acetyl esterase/lipase
MLVLAVLMAVTVGSIAGCSGGPPSPSPTPTLSSRDTFATVDGTRLSVDACIPSKGAKHPMVVMLHGGSFYMGAAGDLTRQCTEGAKRGFAMFSVDYRLQPTRFPGQLEDVGAAVQWLKAPAQTSRFSTDPHSISLLGVSAGGVIAAELAVGVPGSPLPKSTFRSVVLLSGGYLFQEDALNEDLRQIQYRYLGCSPTVACTTAPAASAALHVAANDPPMLIVGSTHELVPVAQPERFAAALAQAGARHRLILVPGTAHANDIVDLVPAANQAMWAFLKNPAG